MKSLPVNLCCLFATIAGQILCAQELQLKNSPNESAIAAARKLYEITGTDERNNPLRWELAEAFTGNEMFVTFRLRYDANSIDTPAEDEGEFFVLWLDQHEGGDAATHSGGVPNIGIHIVDGENGFMARYDSGQEKFTKTRLQGDREYHLVGRLWKSKRGASEPFDSLDIWVDPKVSEENKPHASTRSNKSFAAVSWIGFSTGRKTEPSDRILVANIAVSKTWDGVVLGLPTTTPKPKKPAPPKVARRTIDFKQHVFPILKSRCFECHSGDDPESDLRLDVYDDLLNQVSPRHADASKLVALVSSSDVKKRMPPDGPSLSAEELKTLRTWIDEGVEWNEKLLPTPTPKSDHWAFQPIKRPAVPSVKNENWVATPIDAFIASRHEEQKLVPAKTASSDTLARRLALDLVGLPPDVEIRKLSPDEQVEKLLASPQYGERWGRHWLDVARWAESNGHQHNRERPHAWRYRDYVIQSFNDDKPFDQFVREQIAGDLVAESKDALVATGFLAAARYSGNELDKEIQLNDILVDVVNTTSNAFLGLTMQCAQCHTHKFDPISIRDYYRFQAFFTRGQPADVVFTGNDGAAQKLINARWQLFDNVQTRLVEAKRKRGFPEPILVIPKSVVSGMRKDEREKFKQLESQIAALPKTWAWFSPESRRLLSPHEMRYPLPHDTATINARETYLLLRGEVKSRGPSVEPGWPVVFGPTESSPTRESLANWIASPSNPLTARVWVNRIWQWHFGRGLVKTSGDFGTQGTKPTHPALLDWLASELIDSGWSTKHIHRLILRSNTYRQSSQMTSANHGIDPGNELYWRWKPRRLEWEAIRDNVLAVAGTLDEKRGGPSVSREKIAASSRRSVYLRQVRDRQPQVQTLFDGANAVTSCSRRRVSTTPLQPLYLLNSEFMQRSAAQLAKRVKESSPDDEFAAAMRLAIGRDPTSDESERAKEFLKQNSFEDLCLVLLNLNEFLYIP